MLRTSYSESEGGALEPLRPSFVSVGGRSGSSWRPAQGQRGLRRCSAPGLRGERPSPIHALARHRGAGPPYTSALIVAAVGLPAPTPLAGVPASSWPVSGFWH
jgi:hypothetical protein